MKKILTFAAVVEVGTGLVLIVDPAMVISLLLGPAEGAEGTPIGRLFGVALLALGLACWPGRQGAEISSAAFRAMLTYNILVASYLAHLGAVASRKGLLLWPGVALHAIVALWLVWAWRGQRRDSSD